VEGEGTGCIRKSDLELLILGRKKEKTLSPCRMEKEGEGLNREDPPLLWGGSEVTSPPMKKGTCMFFIERGKKKNLCR